MYLAFPPILGGYSPTAYLVLAGLIAVVITIFVVVYRMMNQE